MPNSKDFNHFEYNPVDIDISRSAFNLDHSVKFSCDCGEVIPFDCIECVPGDTFSVDLTKVVRLQPLVAPIFDEILMDNMWFFVPSRLVWNHWKEFMGENNQSAWAPEVEYRVPLISSPEGGWNVGTIADYFGIPPKKGGISVNALPFRAYALICDQWFRSEAVMNPVHCYVDDTHRTGVNSDDQVTDIELGGKPFIACKLHDYFTSALPSPQRGMASNVFPSGVVAPVVPMSDAVQSLIGVKHPYSYGVSYDDYPSDPTTVTHVVDGVYSSPSVNRNIATIAGTEGDHYTSSLSVFNTSVTVPTLENDYWTFNNLFAELPASTFNINDLRQAFAVQRYLERSARFGGRYIEFIRGFFGVDSPDARLQRTEYLGGSRLSLNINQQ